MNVCGAYRAHAEACAKLAEAVTDPYHKLVLLNMAEGWLRLAGYVERRDQNEVREHFGADSSSEPGCEPQAGS
jgi:hypothetical protein